MAKTNTHPFRLFKRGDIWHAYISIVAGGRRHIIRESTGETDISAAQSWCLDRIARIRRAPELTHQITLDSAAGKWMLEVGQYQSSKESRMSLLQGLITDFGGKTLLSQITKADIFLFIERRRNRGAKPATINRYLSALSALCTRAQNYWDCNVPSFKLSQFKQKEPQENIKYFKNWDDVQRLLNACAPHIRPIIQTAIYTGLRRGRILGMKWDQIDWDNHQIVYMGKDGRPHSVPMVKPLEDALRQLPRRGDYVFTYHGVPIRDIKTAWHNAFKKAGIAYMNFHTLRHTTATWLIRQTGNLKLVQTVLGHSNISVTTKYAHLVSNESRAAMRELFE